MKKNSLNWLIGIILGLVFLGIWLNIVDWQEFIKYFRKFDLTSVLLFSFFYVLAYFFRSWRWKIIIHPIKKLSYGESFSLFMAGLMMNYIIPIRAGEFAKSIILKNKYQIRISKSLPTIFIDKMTDLFPILLIMVLVPMISIKMNVFLNSVIMIIFLIFLFFLGFLFFAVNHEEKAITFLHKFLIIIPRKYRIKLEEFFENFVVGMSIMKQRYFDGFKVSLLTFLAVISEAIYIYAVFRAFGAEISYMKILFGYTLMNLTYILPTPPAQIGSNQFMWVLIFGFALGINENLTSAAVTFSHLLTSFWIFFIGSLSLLTLKIKFHELIRINDKR